MGGKHKLEFDDWVMSPISSMWWNCKSLTRNWFLFLLFLAQNTKLKTMQ
jgi:hypothetical protein